MLKSFPPARRVFGWSAGGPTLLVICYYAMLCCGTTTVAQESDAALSELNADPQLMGWWRFDETTGSEAADSSPHGRTARLSGSQSFDKNSVAGRHGRAFEFGGREQIATIVDYQGVTGTEPRTIALWIKTQSPKGDLVSWGKDDFGQMWILRFIRGHLGVTPNGGYYYMAAEIHDGQWHHVAAVVAKAELPNLHDHVTLYLDGKIAEIDRIGLLDLWPIETGADKPVIIGKGFQGALDDLRIYARALSEEEIQQLHRLKRE